MGQIFNACAYDIDSKICYVYYGDKFHAECYSFSGAVFSMHYLLRQASYRIMWGGDYAALLENLSNFSNEEELLGISTYADDVEIDTSEYGCNEQMLNKAKFITENYNLWNRMDISDIVDKSYKYFDWEMTHSVKYTGYLLNHSKKSAVDLKDFFNKSISYHTKGERFTIDPLPILTETGGGTQMALIDGISTDSTEELAGIWCGDLLQITDALPNDYILINCCFADMRSKARYCLHEFGTSDAGLLLKDKNDSLFTAAMLSFHGKRGNHCYLNVRKEEDSYILSPVYNKD